MTRDEFISFLKEKLGFIDNYDRKKHFGRGYKGLALLAEVPHDTISIRFYSRAQLNKVASINGPWIAKKMLDNSVPVIFHDRSEVGEDKRVYDEGIVVEIKPDPGIKDLRLFAEQIEKTLAELNDITAAKKERKSYNSKHADYIKGYAQRRRSFYSGLSDEELKEERIINDSSTPSAPQSDSPVLFSDPKDKDDKPLSRNLIFFGAPGTGKSFKLKVAVEGEVKEDGTIIKDENRGIFVMVKDGKVDKRLYERVTFYPTYSYAQFVGCYKPVMEKPADGGKEEIAYRFVPGPFLRVLVNALKAFPPKLDEMSLSQLQDYVRKLRDSDREAKDKLHISESNGKPSGEWKNTAKLIEMLKEYYKNKKHCLVIEEINRANAAAVFGDVFQLLDRQGNGESEYDVAASKDVKRYLKKELAKDEYKCAREFLGVESNGIIELDEEGEWRNCRLRIPSNMYIWATMNSADQGVFPMDTAFKRRWEFEYVGIDDGSTGKCSEWTIGKADGFKWNALRTFINELLSLHGVNEDKLMGPWFVKPEKDNVVSDKQFKSKVLMYLWEDAARMCRAKVFAKDVITFSKLIEKWKNNGPEAFKCDGDTLAKMKEISEEMTAPNGLGGIIKVFDK